jgi:hypothetical protein
VVCAQILNDSKISAMEYEDSRIQSAAIVFTYVKCRVKLCTMHSEERDKELQTNFVTQEHEEVYCLLG